MGKVTKTECIKRHLEEYGNITSWEAIQEYGVTRLSAIIFNLRKAGINISNEWISFTDRFGNDSKYVKYILKKEVV